MHRRLCCRKNIVLVWCINPGTSPVLSGAHLLHRQRSLCYFYHAAVVELYIHCVNYRSYSSLNIYYSAENNSTMEILHTQQQALYIIIKYMFCLRFLLNYNSKSWSNNSTLSILANQSSIFRFNTWSWSTIWEILLGCRFIGALFCLWYLYSNIHVVIIYSC